MGFPVLLKATSGDLGAAGGVVILAVTLTRAPLLVPLTAMQGNLIAHFVDQRSERLRALAGAGGGRRRARRGRGAGRRAARAVAAAGRRSGPSTAPSGALLAWLTAAAVAIALLTLTGAATVAAALHRAYSLGWVGATVASALLLLLPLALETRTVVALLCGPLVGIAVHLAALARASGDADRVYFGRHRHALPATFGSSSPPSTRRASSATSSPTCARFSTTSSASTTAARDDTGDIALRAGAHVVRHPVNLGQGAAIQTGVEYARSQPGAQVFATFDADGQHRVKDVVRDDRPAARRRRRHRHRHPVRRARAPSRPPLLKRIVLRDRRAAEPDAAAGCGLTDAHNGLRVFNKKVADGLNITMNGMSHASEFIALVAENHWRVAEEPVEILYTDYSKSKGQPLLNGVNIIFDGLLRGRMSR